MTIGSTVSLINVTKQNRIKAEEKYENYGLLCENLRVGRESIKNIIILQMKNTFNNSIRVVR